MAGWQTVARRAAQRWGLDADVFVRQISAESGFNPRAVSPAGARGIAQIMPATARSWGVNPDDPRAALDAAAKNMAGYVRQFGSVEKALRAYNAGPGNVERSRSFAETNAYVAKILGGRGAPAPAPAGSAAPAATPTGDGAARGALIAEFVQNKGADPLDFALKVRAASQQPRPPAQPPRAAAASTGAGSSEGGFGGAVRTVDAWAGGLGVPVTAKEEPGHAAGGDHDPAVQGATARDYGGSEAQRRALFHRITRALGVNAVYKGADINVVKNGVRWQIISRDHGTGPHLHVGWRQA